MKILQVIEFFTPSCGGSVASTYNLSKELSNLGHKVTILTTDFKFDKKYVESIEKKGVTVIPFRCVSNIKSFFISPSIKKWLKENIKNFDIIHMQNFRTYQNAFVHKYAKKYKIPYVLQPRGSAQKEDKTFLKTFFDLIFGYMILKNAKKVILSSKNEYILSKEILKKGGVEKENIEYIPNGIDASSYQKLPSKNCFRENYNIKHSAKIILYLGRIHERKGIDMLIDAYELLINEKNMANSKLIITGPDDGYEEELKDLVRKKKIKKNVLFTGPLYEDDKIDAYTSSDVFVLPSIDQQESFGNVVLEASACGTPCVVTNVCGVSEYMCNIIKVNPDVESIKEGIKKALQKDNLGEQARKEVLKKLSWKSIVKNDLIPMYHSI